VSASRSSANQTRSKVATSLHLAYQSVHFVGRIHPSRSGPRYDSIKGQRFEIQVRTILMDAWANVSNYLDYKSDRSIPSELRRDFFALSGLFYVAEQHLEPFQGVCDQPRVCRRGGRG
jgi:ppGpp synthetase/RelA/SpoT-type nucleotidyltranferase